MPTDPELQARRRAIARDAARARVVVGFVLATLAHAAFVPLLVLYVASRLRVVGPRPEPKVAFVQVPPEQWDAQMGSAPAARPSPVRRAERLPPVKQEEEAKKKEAEQAPAQVVETSPGNQEEAPDARFAAETANRTDRETIARKRKANAKAVTPRESTSIRPPESRSGRQSTEKSVALGSPEADGTEQGPRTDFGSKLELPSLLHRERLALKLDSEKNPGTLRNREATEELEGNSKRFRVQVGAGEGDAANPSTGGPAGARDVASLLPSDAVIDRISGAPAPDHVENVDEGDGTFLNTREWKYASFFNRIKQGIANNWDPGTALRRRDPSGDMYAWKDRYTIVQVTLAEDGRLKDIFVEKSCGVDFLDREAISAFEKAQPFPNPPTGIVDARDEIHFSFGFFLETSRPSLQLFRGP